MGRLKLIDLFSGIGGFSLAAHWCGWETAMFCEIEKFPRQVLQKNFPGVLIRGNVKGLKARQIKDYLTYKYGYFDANELVLTGGFPCQPFSQAGKRKGGKDKRALFGQILRIAKHLRPKWMVLENVYGIVNISDGEYLEQEVITPLAKCGYEVQPYIIPASAVGAWHRRDRTWFVCRRKDAIGHPTCDDFKTQQKIQRWKNSITGGSGRIDATKNTFSVRCHSGQRESKSKIGGFGQFGTRDGERVYNESVVANTGCERPAERQEQAEGIEQCGECVVADTNHARIGIPGYAVDGKRTETSTERRKSRTKFGRHSSITPDSDNERSQGCGEHGERAGESLVGQSYCELWDKHWYEVAAEVCRVPNGLPYELYKLETANRVGRLKALGNAIVPQVAYQIFQVIKMFEDAQ